MRKSSTGKLATSSTVSPSLHNFSVSLFSLITFLGTFILAKISPIKSLSLSLFLSKTSSAFVSEGTPTFFAPSIALFKLSYLSYTFISSFFFISSILIASGSHLFTNLDKITPSWTLSYKSSVLGSIGILEPQSGSPERILFINFA